MGAVASLCRRPVAAAADAMPAVVNLRSWRAMSSPFPSPWRSRMCAVRGWTTNYTPPAWIATNSARCSWQPGSARPGEHAPVSLLALHGAAGVRSGWRRHRRPGHRPRAPDAGGHPQGRQGRHGTAGAAHDNEVRPGPHPRSTGMQPTSWPPTSLALPVSPTQVPAFREPLWSVYW
jgi:hypothetical protein